LAIRFPGFYPIFFDLLQGQDILPLLLFLRSPFVSLKQNNDLAAGCLAGARTLPFHLVLPLVFILCFTTTKSIDRFVLVAFIWCCFDCNTGWNGALSYPAFVWHIETVMGTERSSPVDMPNLRGLLHTFLAARSSKLVIQTRCGSFNRCFVVVRIREVEGCTRGNSNSIWDSP